MGSAYEIIAYVTADIDGDSSTYVGIRCARDTTGRAYRGASGVGMSATDLRLVGVNLHNSAGDVADVVSCGGYRINNGSLTQLQGRKIRRIDIVR